MRKQTLKLNWKFKRAYKFNDEIFPHTGYTAAT